MGAGGVCTPFFRPCFSCWWQWPSTMCRDVPREAEREHATYDLRGQWCLSDAQSRGSFEGERERETNHLLSREMRYVEFFSSAWVIEMERLAFARGLLPGAEATRDGERWGTLVSSCRPVAWPGEGKERGRERALMCSGSLGYRFELTASRPRGGGGGVRGVRKRHGRRITRGGAGGRELGPGWLWGAKGAVGWLRLR